MCNVTRQRGNQRRAHIPDERGHDVSQWHLEDGEIPHDDSVMRTTSTSIMEHDSTISRHMLLRQSSPCSTAPHTEARLPRHALVNHVTSEIEASGVVKFIDTTSQQNQGTREVTQAEEYNTNP